MAFPRPKTPPGIANALPKLQPAILSSQVAAPPLAINHPKMPPAAICVHPAQDAIRPSYPLRPKCSPPRAFTPHWTSLPFPKCRQPVPLTTPKLQPALGNQRSQKAASDWRPPPNIPPAMSVHSRKSAASSHFPSQLPSCSHPFAINPPKMPPAVDIHPSQDAARPCHSPSPKGLQPLAFLPSQSAAHPCHPLPSKRHQPFALTAFKTPFGAFCLFALRGAPPRSRRVGEEKRPWRSDAPGSVWREERGNLIFCDGSCPVAVYRQQLEFGAFFAHPLPLAYHSNARVLVTFVVLVVVVLVCSTFQNV